MMVESVQHRPWVLSFLMKMAARLDLAVRTGQDQKIVLDDIDQELESSFTVICDVSNPLTGPDGATAVYGPQRS